MRNCKTFCFAFAVALALASAPAAAQVYSWRDPATGQSRISNIAPPWYSRGEIVNGPRVIATAGGKVIDDTALSYEKRLLLSGKSNGDTDKLPQQKQQGPTPAREQDRDFAGPPAAGRLPAGNAPTRAIAGKDAED